MRKDVSTTFLIAKFFAIITVISALGWLYELISAFSIFGLCTFKFLQNKFIIDISESSYAIYLLHMAFVGICAKIYGLHFSVSLVANIIVLLVVFGLILLGKIIAKIIKLENVYNICLGLRKIILRRKADLKGEAYCAEHARID